MPLYRKYASKGGVDWATVSGGMGPMSRDLLTEEVHE